MPKVTTKNVPNTKRYRVLDNADIRKFMEDNIYTHPNEVKTRYKPEKNWKETLRPNRNNEITDPDGHLADEFYGFIVENLKGKKIGKFTIPQLHVELMSKTKHTFKQKDYWNKYFLGSIKDLRINLLKTVYPIATYLKKLKRAGYGVQLNYRMYQNPVTKNQQVIGIDSYEIKKTDSKKLLIGQNAINKK